MPSTSAQSVSIEPKLCGDGGHRIVRRRLEHVEFRVGERGLRCGERRGGIGSADHIGDIPPLGMMLEKQLGGVSRARLVDIVEHDDAIWPDDSCRTHEIEQGEFELVVAVDQHQVVEHAVADRPVEMKAGVDGQERDPLAELGRQSRNDRRATLAAEGVDRLEMPVACLPQATRHHLRGAGVIGAELQGALGAAHDDQMVQQRAGLVALQRSRGIVACRMRRLARMPRTGATRPDQRPRSRIVHVIHREG